MTIATWSRMTFAGAMALTGAACAVLGPQPDLARFYVLEAMAEGAPGAAVATEVVVGLGPVRVPDYLGRLEMAERASATELRYLGNERWAEPLDQGLARVLNENLRVRIGAGRIVPLPTMQRAGIRFEVPIEVLRFEAGPDAQVHLVAVWALRDTRTGEVVDERESRIAVPLVGPGGDARALAMSRAVLELAEEIAARIAAAEAPL